MSKAQICPVCNGIGKYSDSHNGCTISRDCHGCGGKGWIEVGGCDYPSYPPPYYPGPWYYGDRYPWTVTSSGTA
jgi:hypothetical protein